MKSPKDMTVILIFGITTLGAIWAWDHVPSRERSVASATPESAATAAPVRFDTRLSQALYASYVIGLERDYLPAKRSGEFWSSWNIATQLQAACENREPWTRPNPDSYKPMLDTDQSTYQISGQNTARALTSCMERTKAE